jgi:hypothetical protein
MLKNLEIETICKILSKYENEYYITMQHEGIVISPKNAREFGFYEMKSALELVRKIQKTLWKMGLYGTCMRTDADTENNRTWIRIF